jgi:subtilisin family serine protease
VNTTTRSFFRRGALALPFVLCWTLVAGNLLISNSRAQQIQPLFPGDAARAAAVQKLPNHIVKGQKAYRATVFIDRAVQTNVMLQKESRTKAERKLESSLLEVVKQVKLDGSLAKNATKLRLMDAANGPTSNIVQADAMGRIYVYVTVAKGHTIDEATVAITKLGGKVDISNEQFSLMQVWIDPKVIPALAASDAINGIRRVIDPITSTGAVTSEGVARMRADAAGRVFSTDGTGVKVGVMSDDCGETPGGLVTTRKGNGELGPSTVVYDDGLVGSRTHEGLAMMEIVQDMAPGAQVYFATAFTGEANFAANIVNLKNQGCKVITDDVIYFDEPVYEDGIVAAAVNTVTAAGVLYTSSAGNNGTGRSLNGVYSDMIAGSGPLVGKHVCNIGGGIFLQSLLIGAGGTAQIVLHWDDKYGSSGNDYDLYLVNSANSAILASSTNVQAGAGDPWEILGYTNGSGSTIQTYIVLVRSATSGTDPNLTPRYKVDAFGFINLTSAVSASSTFGHSTANGCVSAGAIEQANSSYNVIESFSSQGPATMVDFSVPGSRAVLQTRNKPDVAAIDGVATSVTPNFAVFHGTSCATPHVAGVAALLLQKFPSLTPAQAKAALIAGCIDYGAAGVDNVFGGGRLDAFKTLALASDGAVYKSLFNSTLSNIPDGGSTTSTVNFGTAGLVADSVYLSVTVDNHSKLGDLTFTLTGPDLTAPIVMNRPVAGAGNSTAKDANVVLGDVASTNIQTLGTAGAETFGYYIPNSALSTAAGFKNRALTGTWTLTVADGSVNGITGTLKDWGLFTKLVPTGPPPSLALAVDQPYIYSSNHALKTVNVTETVTNGTTPVITLVSVTSNEPDAGTSPSDVPGDIIAPTGVNTTALQLRAECAPLSNGRIYTATYNLSDVGGFSQNYTITVPVLCTIGHAFTGPVINPPNVILNPPNPNPVVTTTTISYNLPSAGNVNLKIFNMRGKWQKNLDYGAKTAGPHSVTWDGKRADGFLLPDGPYVYQLNANGVLRSGIVTLNH